MTKRTIIWLFLVLALPALTVSGAPLQIAKSVKANPSLYLDVSRCSPELKKHVESLLVGSFYFTPVSGENADYRLSVVSEPDGAAVSRLRGKTLSRAKRFRAPDERTKAKMLVDDVLETVFQIPNLCRSRIVFAAQNDAGIRNIFSCSLDGGDFAQLTKFSTLCVEPCYFPDGDSVAYTRYTPNSTTDILETRSSSGATRRLASFRGLNTGVSVSPDGQRMALILSKDKQLDLYVKDIDSPRLTRLTRDDAVEASPCWSPDGRKLCFVSDASGRPELYVIDRDGSNRRKLPGVGREAYTPDWSQQNKIAYVARIGNTYGLAVLDMKNGENELVPNVSGNWESPSWAPDGRLLSCSRRESNTRSSLFVIDSRTGMTRRLFRSSGSFSSPNWSKGAAR